MKGKVKSLFICVACLVVLLTASICLSIFGQFSRAKVYADTTPGVDYSQSDNSNIILSAEKVAVVSTGEDYNEEYDELSPFSQDFVSNRDDKITMPINSANYYFKNIKNGTNDKYVIQNNSFVMLNNEKYNKTIDGKNYTYYRNPKMASVSVDGVNTTLADAILFTFGTYYKDNNDNLQMVQGENTDETSSKEVGAGLTYVNVRAWRNGTTINLPPVRQFNNSMYQDFAFIIPQKEGYEGYYRFEVDYFRGDGTSDSQEFGFYLLFESSYNGVMTFETRNYTSQPTIENALAEAGAYKYYLGNMSTNNYPTITYDYTKYTLEYTHTSNGRVTKYSYRVETASNSGVWSASLICDITGSGENRTIRYPMTRYDSTRTNNIVTILLTEMGTYNFSYRYIYAGYNADTAPEINEFLVVPNTNEYLYMHGFELKYSKESHLEAQMRYLTLSKNEKDAIDIVVPNGYDRETGSTDSRLGIVYTLNSTANDKKVGNTITTQDANIKNILDSEGLDVKYLKSLLNMDTLNASPSADFETKLKNIEKSYEKTNQGSLWLMSNDTFVLGESFYLYSTMPIRYSDNSLNATVTRYTNQTTFNKTGYYLAFMRVAINGNTNHTNNYYQVFAFQYTTDTIEINTTIVDDNSILGSNGYTNKNVEVTWETPKVFERAVTARYYSVSEDYPTKEQLLRQTPRPLENGQILGGGLTRGARFLIELKSEGESASYKMFTIDKEDISGVGVYAVQKRSSTGTNIYEFVLDSLGDPVRLDTITNSLSAISWSDKASGANIEASYTVTPFVRDNSIAPDRVRNDNNSELWFSNNYRLGTTVGPYDIEKADMSGILYKDILQRQGIYIFSLKDKAGNSCKYMFIIDDTENYFMIDGKMQCRSSLLFTDNVEVELATHKVIEVTLGVDYQNTDLYKILNLATRNANGQEYKNSVNYYTSNETGSTDNIATLNRLFAHYSNKSYLKVRNTSMLAYDHTGVADNNLTINAIDYNNRSRVIGNQNVDSENSIVRRLYLSSENQLSTNRSAIRSYVLVEVNKDSSLGMAFTSPDNFDENGLTSSTRLYTWSDISKATATSDNFVAFTWKMGEGNYEVDYLGYEFYTLNGGLFDANDRYFYTSLNKSEDIYKGGAFLNGAKSYIDSSNGNAVQKGFALLNVKNNQTEAGLYIVTRTYKGTGSETEEEKKNLTKKYYFIVDRNGIIERESFNGGNINIGLLENESAYDEFNSINPNPLYFEYSETIGTTTQTKRIYYTPYLTTNKVPATLNIPVGKYFDGTNGSTYYAGRLKFELFFVDRENQIEKGDKRIIKLFEIDEEDSTKYNKGYYPINIQSYLNDVNREWANKFVRPDNSTNWLCLPGDYVVKITDMVAGVSGNHEKIIGFRIASPNKPTTDVYSVSDENIGVDGAIYEATLKNNVYTLTTSEEFVKVELPKYNADDENAQVDVDYLVVEMTRYGRTTSYINYQYANVGGDYNLDVTSDVVHNNTDGSRTIILETFLRDSIGNINPIDPNENLSYKITIRYKVRDKSNTPKYLNAYYYYDLNGNVQTYYENTYNVIVDKVAPTTNIEYLESTNDNLMRFYKTGDSMFEHAVYDTASGVHFVNQYRDYYVNDRDESLIYAYRVNAETPFNTTDDIETIYYRAFDKIEGIDLTLPRTNFSNYIRTEANILTSSTYGSLINDTRLFGKYIEIVELDAAGNMTQYVVLYCPDNENAYNKLNIGFTVDVLTNGAIGTEENGFVIDLSKTDSETITIFNIETCTISEVPSNDVKELFYRFELTGLNNSVFKYINTNGLTDFSLVGLAQDIVNMIKESGQGNYTLKIYTRDNVHIINLNYYDKRESLMPSKLIENRNGKYVINMQGANEIKDGVMYYAKEIILTTPSGERRFICDPSQNYSYKDSENGSIINILSLENDGTYQVRLIDAFGVESAPYRFRTDGSSEFSSISFEGENEENYVIYDGRYYGYTEATVKYDTTLYTAEIKYSVAGNPSIKVSSNDDIVIVQHADRTIIRHDKVNGIVTIYPYYNADNIGDILEVSVQCMYNGVQENSYNVAIDTRNSTVALRDNNNMLQKMQVYINTPFENTTYETTTSGTMSLSWGRDENEYFDYTYTLHETKLDGSIVSLDLTDTTRHIINTKSDSLGLYRFEIRVYTHSGNYLGNKVYVFSVQAVVNELYFVQTLNNELMHSNSNFTFSEVLGLNINANSMWSNLGLLENNTPNIMMNLPLYLYNQELRVVTAVDRGATEYHYTYTPVSRDYTLTIYRISMNTYSIYFGIMQVPNTNELVTDVTIANGDKKVIVNNTTTLEFTMYGTKSDVIDLTMTQLINNPNTLTVKNNLVLEISYNDILVESRELRSFVQNSIRLANYKILGNGKYSFVIRDIAGNTHEFDTEYGVTREYIDVNVLREVIITMNGDAPIDNAYINGRVVLNVFNPQIYSGLVNISVTRNGVTGDLSDYDKSQNTYTFSKYGTYRVVFTADYQGMTLSRELMFTIVNQNEARETFDLSSILGYEITKVTNNTGVDITDEFLKMINPSLNMGGSLVSYDNIVEYDMINGGLGIVSGKNKFSVTYLVDDQIYPKRDVTFAFTLNNEMPNIESSLEAGKSTTKGFTIRFNPGIIYEQIGDSFVYINDVLISEINEHSSTQIIEYTVNQKVDGEGDFYVKVVSSSGNIITSFKIEITKPLNVWAIIVIVVVSVAVVSVTVVIIVLRNKMRIR